MKVVVTGAGGFLGARLADELLSASGDGALRPSALLLTDSAEPAARADPRVRTLALDLAAAGAAARLLAAADGADLVFHLAAVVSGAAERDFDLGLRVNLDATRALLEAARARAGAGARPLVFVFASTVGVYGGELPARVDESTAPAPESSYGAAKAAAELLVAEYSRRGFVDGRSVRLPTVTVRGGAPNAAVTSFASGVVREPLRGELAALPVPPERELWVCSPRAAVRNLVRAARVRAAALGPRRALNLPGLRVSAAGMVAALRAEAGAEAAARVSFAPRDSVDRLVASFPVQFDDSAARLLGFEANASFADIVREYVDEIRK